MASPLPKKTVKKEDISMDFYQALKEIVNGNKVCKRSWGAADEWFYLGNDGFLNLHKADGEHNLLLHVDDITGTDWFILGD